MINDVDAQALFAGLLQNNYLVKLNLEANPIKHSIFRDCEAQTKANLQKYGAQEWPLM
jgi:hypothetical protein